MTQTRLKRQLKDHNYLKWITTLKNTAKAFNKPFTTSVPWTLGQRKLLLLFVSVHGESSRMKPNREKWKMKGREEENGRWIWVCTEVKERERKTETKLEMLLLLNFFGHWHQASDDVHCSKHRLQLAKAMGHFGGSCFSYFIYFKLFCPFGLLILWYLISYFKSFN